jgi:hypothetical protein
MLQSVIILLEFMDTITAHLAYWQQVEILDTKIFMLGKID